MSDDYLDRYFPPITYYADSKTAIATNAFGYGQDAKTGQRLALVRIPPQDGQRVGAYRLMPYCEKHQAAFRESCPLCAEME